MLRLLSSAAPIVRLISTLGLLVVVQSAIELHYGNSNHLVEPYLPHDVFDWGGVSVQEQVLYIIGITFVVTGLLWAFARYSRVGLAITAAAQNEQAVQTMGWSPNRLAALTWGLGGGLAGLAGVLLAPLTGLSTITFTLIVTVTAMAAALLGGFRSFPLTLLGGFVVGFGEAWVVRHRMDIQDFFGVETLVGIERAIPFLLILLVLVVRGRGLPLRSHITDRLPKLGTGKVSIPGLLIGSGVLLFLLFAVMDDRWAAATNISLISAIVVLSIVVLTGYAGQLSLGQWALAGAGALIAGSFVLRADVPLELALPLGVLLTIPVGLLFALPALRTRGVNLAIVTLGLGFTIQAVVFTNVDWIGGTFGGEFNSGTKVGSAELFGIDVNNATHPQRWTVVCLIAFVLCGLAVANLRRSRTGRRLLAVRTNERAAASLGISVFGVKLYAFSVAAAIAGLAGILLGFRATIITYDQYSPLQSIFSVGWAVIGGLGFAVGAVFSAANAIGGLGTLFFDDVLSIGDWDALVGGVILLVIIVVHQDGIAEVVTHQLRPTFERLRLVRRPGVAIELPDRPIEPVAAGTLAVQHLTVRFGGVIAVDDVGFDVRPGEVVGLIGPNGAGKTTIIDAVTGFVKPASGRAHAERRADRPVVGHQTGPARAAALVPVARAVRRRQRRGQHPRRCRRRREPSVVGHRPDLARTPRPVADRGRRDTRIRPRAVLAAGARRTSVRAAAPRRHRRAVASGPSVIMLDEPAAGLDDTESRELASLIRGLADERRMGVLLVEHDVNLVMNTCDRIIVLNFGAVIATGTPAEVRDDPLVKDAYLGGGEVGDIDAMTAGTTATESETVVPQ